MEPVRGLFPHTAGAAGVTPLFGRTDEYEALRAGFNDACAGRGRVFQILGEPGIGKSRLARAMADHARERGALLAWGRCWEGGGAPAYWPWVQVIRSVLEARPDSVTSLVTSGGAAVAEIVPELRAHVGEVAPTTADPDVARFALFDATSRLLRSSAGDQALVVLLEDLHAADPASLLLLRFVAREIPESRVLVLATTRTVGADTSASVMPLLADLARETTTICLHGLAPGEVHQFLQATAPSVATEELALRMYETTGGNPFFLDQLCRDLGGGHGSTVRRVPEGVREVVRQRLALLSDGSREILSVAAVMGQTSTLAALQMASGLEGQRLIDLLGEALAADILVDPDGDARRYNFVHALMRETIYGDLMPSERLQLHGRVAEALERLYRADPDPHLAELAHHFVAAATVGGDRARAVEICAAAAARAMRLLAYEEATAQLEQALEVAELCEDVDDRWHCRLLLALGDARWSSGDLNGSKSAWEAAAVLARRLGDTELLATAALGRGRISEFGIVDPSTMGLLEEALSVLADTSGSLRARALGRLAIELQGVPDPAAYERSLQLANDAVELARRLDDPGTLAQALSARHHVGWSHDNAEQRLETAEEILRLAQRAADTEMALQGHMWAMIAWLERGDVPAYETSLTAYARLARSRGQPLPLFYAASRSATAALLTGQFGQAAEVLEEASTYASRSQNQEAMFIVKLQRAFLAWELGDLEQLRSFVPEAMEWAARFDVDVLAAPLGCVAWLQVESGDRQAARRVLARAARHGFSRLCGWSQDYFCALAWFADVAVALDDRPRAAELYELLLPSTGRNIVAGGALAFWGSIDHHLGMVAAVLGRTAEAQVHFEAALERHEAMGAHPWVNRTAHEYAQLLLNRDDPGDQDRASRILEQARTRSKGFGCPAAVADPGATNGTTPPFDLETISDHVPVFTREGDYWSVQFQRSVVRLRDVKGLTYLAELVRSPGREFHVLELVAQERGIGSGSEVIGHAGELLDHQARAAYRARLKDLSEDLEEAQTMCDEGRVAVLQAEIDSLIDQLAGAVGLGGRSRLASSANERARVSVTNALRRALARIQQAHPALANHLASSIQTGSFCVYQPRP